MSRQPYASRILSVIALPDGESLAARVQMRETKEVVHVEGEYEYSYDQGDKPICDALFHNAPFGVTTRLLRELSALAKLSFENKNTEVHAAT